LVAYEIQKELLKEAESQELNDKVIQIKLRKRKTSKFKAFFCRN
jgi:hypothetical protein